MYDAAVANVEPAAPLDDQAAPGVPGVLDLIAAEETAPQVAQPDSPQRLVAPPRHLPDIPQIALEDVVGDDGIRDSDFELRITPGSLPLTQQKRQSDAEANRVGPGILPRDTGSSLARSTNSPVWRST
jgi:hypothetical protein